MIELRQTTLVEADYTEPFEDRVDILFHELELATKWQCPSLLLAIYSSEFVHGDAERSLENRLLDLGQKAHHIVVKSQEDADIPLLISEVKDMQNAVVFVDGLQWGCGQGDYNAYRCLDKHREFFIENRIRVVFWLTETEAIHLAHYAPDYWTFRHRVIEFVDSPRPEQIQPALPEAACPVPDQLSEATVEDLDAKITLRAALLTDLPDGAESTAARANLLLTLGILHWRRGDYDQATHFLNTALELAARLQDNRFEGLCYNAIALVDTALGKTEAAIQAYERAVELAPEQITPWNNLGSLQAKLGHHEDSAAAYKKAVEQNPQDPLSWAGLGEAHTKLGRHEDALFAFRKNLELNPTNAHAWIGLGDVYAAEGQWEDALAAYQKGMEIEPVHPRVWNEMGHLHYQAGAHEEALQAYGKAMELGLHTSQTYQNLATIHLGKGNYQEAVPMLQKGIELQSDPAQAAPLWNQLGDAYRKLNDYDQALAAYRKADELTGKAAPTQQDKDEAATDPTCGAAAETKADPATATLAIEAEAPSVEACPEATGLIDDSGTMKNESDQDFAQWLEGLSARVPAPSLEAPEAAEVSEGSDTTTTSNKSETSDTSDESEEGTGFLSFTPDEFDLYGPQGTMQELDTATEAPAITENPTSGPCPSDRALCEDAGLQDTEIPPASPDVRTRLEAMRASLNSADTPAPTLEERVEPQGEQGSPELNSSSTPAFAGTPTSAQTMASADAGLPTIGSQPSADPVLSRSILDASSTQADIDARSAQIWNELGNIYYNMVAYDEAINALNKALELDQSYGWTYNNLASIYIHKGNYAEAIPLLKKGIPLLRESKEKAMLWNRLGDAYRRMNQSDKAAEAYQKAVELDPENVSLLTRARFSLLGNSRA